MKKGLVALLIALAIIVLVSPGIVGHLAERSMDENLNWAADEADDVVVTSQGFDRGWFSSQGKHRIELGNDEIRRLLVDVAGAGPLTQVPALIVETHLDHGLIPVSSMAHDKGTLRPGLGSAVSTLSLELVDGTVRPLPGTIYSTVGLTGALHSNYVLEAGSADVDGVATKWGDTDIHVTTDPSSGDIGFDGTIASFETVSSWQSNTVGKITFKGEQSPTPFGMRVGPFEASVESIGSSVQRRNIGPLHVSGVSRLDDDRIDLDVVFELQNAPLGDLGDSSINLEMRLLDLDGQAAGNIKRRLDRLAAVPSADMLEADATRLLAAGFEIHIDSLNIGLPQGLIEATAHVEVDESDRDSFALTALLLHTDASIDLSIPAALVDLAIQADPQANAAVGLGYLRKKGDVYVMQAKLSNGLLQVNGAPVPMPWQ